MANVVEQIYDAIDTLVGTSLTGYQKMRRIFEPEKNDIRNSKSSYAVVHGAASYSEGITRVYTMNHEFRVQIMNTFIERLDDVKIQDEINTLYDKIDSMLVAMFLTKLSLPSIVLIVNEPSIEEPKILDNQAVLISFKVNVKYRNAIA